MEIPVLVLTFGLAAILNKGTNFIFGTISFVSNSIAIVLQLALAIDYAIILCHRYTEEREHLEARDAVVIALTKAIPEISGSSLTTLSGLATLTFMQFRIGYDMGIVLIKAIVFSLLSVFTFMPGLLMTFSKLIDNSHHKSFVPSIKNWGKIVVKLRKVTPIIFAVMLVVGCVFSNLCPYVYSTDSIRTSKKSDSQIAREKIDETFVKTSTLAMLVPIKDYETEHALLNEIEQFDEVNSVMGLANIEAMDGYTLTDRLTPRQFSELTDIDIEIADLLYAAYAANGDSYGKIVGGLDNYTVPMIDMFTFLYEQIEEGFVTLDEEMQSDLDDLNEQLTDAKKQLMGENFNRFVIKLNLPDESDETFAFLDTLHSVAAKYYGDDEVIIVGNATSNRDLSSSFSRDNILISILSVVFVVIVLLFTFQSIGIPILLIVVIQGSIWINFSFPFLEQSPMFFLSYLVVQSIQMGANIDYAIVITNRYLHLKEELPLKEAIVETLDQSFPTIATSGTILLSAGFAIGLLSSDPTISSIGTCLGRGTLISIILVMLILPQLLYLGDFVIEKTSFSLKKPSAIQSRSGSMKLSGHVTGYVQGVIDADFSGTIDGSIEAKIENGDVERIGDDNAEE
jgi:predicted RND superfamily exporter protein